MNHFSTTVESFTKQHGFKTVRTGYNTALVKQYPNEESVSITDEDGDQAPGSVDDWIIVNYHNAQGIRELSLKIKGLSSLVDVIHHE